jgi:crooked neck
MDDEARTRAIYELAVEQDTLDMPELVWKEYIDFETDNEEWERARNLFERLLQRTEHVKVWISYAQFEINASEGDEDEGEEEDEERPVSEEAKKRARAIFERAHQVMKERELKDQRVQLLNAWRAFEQAHGSPEELAKVQKQMPSKVKKRRKLDDDTFEEYMDWLFPADDEREAKLSNLLQMAQKWKQAQQQQSAEA